MGPCATKGRPLVASRRGRAGAAAFLVVALAGVVASSAPVRGQAVRGTLHVVWDGEGSADPDGRAFYLVRPDGSALRLEAGTAPGLDAEALTDLDRRTVALDTEPLGAPGALLPAEARVAGIRALDAAASPFQASPAAYDFVTLLCRFGDDPSSPFSIDEVARVHGSTYPGVAQFYQENSRDPLTMSGNTVAGWYDLPFPRSRYVSGSSTDVGALARDCTAAADGDVDFGQFHGINLQVNGPLSTRSVPPYDVISLGGSWTLDLDGEFRAYGVTWLSGQHATNYVVQTHEVGHALGWLHSSGRYGDEYDSRWDVMSRGYLRREVPWGWLSVHTITNHKRLAGWIPEERIWRPSVGAVETAVISRSALPPSSGYLMALIPREDGVVYTVEARLEAGHDTPLPGESVVLHEVQGRRAYVVDPDRDGNPNDESAQWVPGETFDDAGRAIRVTVEERVAEGFVVTIANQVEPPCRVTLSAAPDVGGSVRLLEGEDDGPCGRSVSVEAAPEEGWRFAEWTVDGEPVSTLNPYPFEVGSDLSLVATFIAQCEVRLSAAPPEGGEATVAEGGATGDCGRQVTVSAGTNEGWRFLEWVEGGDSVSAENPLVITTAQDRELEARFVRQCSVTLVAAPEEGGVVRVESGGDGGDCGRTVTVAAEASEGWGFRRWTEEGEGVSRDLTFSFPLERDRRLSAEFQERCAVAVSANPQEGGSAEVVEGDAEGPCARTVVVEAIPFEGWGFVAWSEDGTELSADPLLELAPARDRALTAGFERVCALALAATPDVGGSAALSEGSASGACGRVVSVTAQAESGWLFVEWVEGGGGMSAEPALTITLEEDRSIEARFVEVGELATRLLHHVLEEGEAPSASERAALDRLGNGNGDLDIGDLLALLDAYPDALGGAP